MSMSKPVVADDTLARLWEAEFSIRDRLRIFELNGKNIGGKLLSWPDPEKKVASMGAIALNVRALTILAEWWCPKVSEPKSPSVILLAREAISAYKWV